MKRAVRGDSVRDIVRADPPAVDPRQLELFPASPTYAGSILDLSAHEGIGEAHDAPDARQRLGRSRGES